jgi:ubiquinone/menaquinone biosynthesis C-methylase UbiE
MSNNDYVHGYTEQESIRLTDQANTLAALLHKDIFYPPGSHVLEVGCGVGSQTVFLATNSPGANFTSIDISVESLKEAEKQVFQRGYSNVKFQKADIYDLPFEKETFDHIFVCFLLEHLSHPENALRILKNIIKPEGSTTVIEGDHGSAYFHPESSYAKKNIQCLIDLQAMLDGNALIGRELYPLLISSGYRNVKVDPRMVYADSSKPELAEGFTKKTFTAMIEGVKTDAVQQGLISETDWDKGIADLYKTAGHNGVFCYTFFKAVGQK